MPEDPVCRIKVAKGTPATTMIYGGKAYYFCSAACKGNFEKAPDRYVMAEAPDQASRTSAPAR